METRKRHKENKLKPEKEKVEPEKGKEEIECIMKKFEREKEELKLERKELKSKEKNVLSRQEQLNLTIENLQHQKGEIRAKIEKETNKIELARHNKAITELSAKIDVKLKQMESIDLQLTTILTEIGLLNTNIRAINSILNKISLKTLTVSEESPSKKSKISETKFKGFVCYTGKST